jgi:peptidoglycan-N-acetylglucosamine deacetylase
MTVSSGSRSRWWRTTAGPLASGRTSGGLFKAALRSLAVLVALGCLAAPAAARSTPSPQRVATSSLTQDGQQLVWTVTLTTPFSPSGMRTDRRELCLIVRRASNSVSGQLCVAPPARNGRSPRLVYQAVTAHGPGRGRVINAAVRRTSSANLRARFLPSDIHSRYGPLRWQVLTTLIRRGCQPLARGSRNHCVVYFPTRSRLLNLHVPQPVGCVPSGASYVTNGSRSRKVIAFTFDDGPWYDTPQFLDVLERKHVPATFFWIGEQVRTYGPAVWRRMFADGDVIGDHTWNHANVSGGGSFASGEISSTASAIRGLTGFAPCLFRAPGGAVSSSLIGLARSMGFITIEWDVDPRDWSRPGTGAILSNVLGNAHSGSIILQHDGGGNRSETLAALPTEIDTLRARGYTFVTIPQLLGIRIIYR